MFKKLLVALVVLIVILGAGVFAVIMYADSLVKAGIEQAGTQATGQNTTLSSAHLGFTGGSLSLDQLRIANPTGFTSPSILSLGEGEVQVSLMSLMDDTIEIPVIQLDRININLIRNKEGQQNLKIILDHLQALSSGSSNQPQTKPQEPAQPGKQFIIKKLAITNVHISLQGYGSEHTSVKLPPIVLEKIGSQTGGGVLAKDLAGIILREITQQMLQNPELLPTLAISGLSQGLEGLGSLGDVGLVRVGEMNESVNKLLDGASGDVRAAVGGELGEEASKLLGNLKPGEGGDMDKAVKDATGALGNLLGGDQKDAESSN